MWFICGEFCYRCPTTILVVQLMVVSFLIVREQNYQQHADSVEFLLGYARLYSNFMVVAVE